MMPPDPERVSLRTCTMRCHVPRELVVHALFLSDFLQPYSLIYGKPAMMPPYHFGLPSILRPPQRRTPDRRSEGLALWTG